MIDQMEVELKAKGIESEEERLQLILQELQRQEQMMSASES